MAKFYSVGTAAQFYSQISLPPKLSFDGVNDYAAIPSLNLFGGHTNRIKVKLGTTPVTGFDGLMESWHSSSLSGVSLRYLPTKQISLQGWTSGASLNFRLDTVNTYNKGDVVDIVFSVSATGAILTVNGVSISASLVGMGIVANNNGVTVMSRDNSAFVSDGEVYELSVGSYSYIQQGDQSNTMVVPSHPSGANGTLENGALWGYVGIEGNYLTPALAVSAITASTPTEQVTIYVLDRSTDVSGIPTTINGQLVTISYEFVKNNSSFDFSLSFNF